MQILVANLDDASALLLVKYIGANQSSGCHCFDGLWRTSALAGAEDGQGEGLHGYAWTSFCSQAEAAYALP